MEVGDAIDKSANFGEGIANRNRHTIDKTTTLLQIEIQNFESRDHSCMFPSNKIISAELCPVKRCSALYNSNMHIKMWVKDQSYSILAKKSFFYATLEANAASS